MMSPSHTVGLEPSEDLACGSSYAVAIPPSGLRTFFFFTPLTLQYASPSHTVGLEQKRKLCFYFRMLRNGRHPTRWAQNSP
jgi:hypothetical protein